MSSDKEVKSSWPEVTTPAIQIARGNADVAQFNKLKETLRRVPSLDVYERSEGIYITSKDLISLERDKQEDEVAQIRDIVLAVAKYEYLLHLNSGSLCELLPDGKVSHSLSVTFNLNFRSSGRLSPVNSIDPACLISKALTDKKIWWILHLYRNLDDSWMSLFKLYEAIKSHAGDRIYEILQTREEKTFTGTVNNPRVIGAQARHGALKYELPKNTMNYDEAQSLISRLISWWFEEYMKIRS